MAGSIAEQLIGTVAQGAQNTTSNLQAGAQLAQGIQQVVDRRAQIEQQKQELQMQKVDKLTSAMETGAKIPSKSARNAYFKEYIPKMQAALGLQDFIPPETMAMIQADPEQAKKFSLLKTKIINGDMSYDQAIAQMQPEEWAMLDEKEVQQLEAAEKFRVTQAGLEARANKPQGRLQAQFDANKMLGIKDKFDANVRKDMERYTAANNALALLSSAQPISDEASKTQLARLAGEVGNLTEADLNRFGGSRALVEQSKQLFSKAAEGKLTDANRKQLLNIAETFKKIVASKIEAQAERSVKGGVALGFDKGKLNEVLDVKGLLGGGNVTLPGQGPQDQKVADYAKQYNLSYEQALQVLQKRGYKPGGK